MSSKPVITLLLLSVFFGSTVACAQQCTTLGQTPSTAFPVCGTTAFTQTTVPICSTNDLFIPGCSGGTGGALYQNKNPFWYKFTCYVSGTLGFVITPLAANEDYDWQLYDITGRNPNDVFTNNNTLSVIGNWAGTYGPTGTSATGRNGTNCASDPNDNEPTFAKMPNLIVGHEYLLLVSHFSDSQSGYNLTFGGGTGVITDPKIPHMTTVKTDCGGTQLTLKLNKKIICTSLTATGSEFSIVPAVTTVTSAVAANCATGFDMDEVVITLAAPLTTGNYQLVINNGTDGNTLRDNCANSIPSEGADFQYSVPQPIFADSVGKVGCAPNQLKVYFPKRINCTSVATNGSDFLVTGGPVPVTVSGVSMNCMNGKTDTITVLLAGPIYSKGNYLLTLRAGTDGNILIDECGIQMPQQSLAFTAVDTVSADFTYNIDLGCRKDTLHFSHDGAHDVNSWIWTFNNTTTALTQNPTIIFPATSSNDIRLLVSNGICTDSVRSTIVLDNEVIAKFDMPDVICPEDPLVVKNTSQGLIDLWRWNFDVISTSTVKDPAPVQFPQPNIDLYYTIKLVTTNIALGCSDSVRKRLRVVNNCYIAVPTAFTPNGDGLNDNLYPNNALKAEDLKFNVYNRWGQLVFRSRNWQDKWNGKIGGIEQGSGVYVWTLEYTHTVTRQKIFQKGTTTLIR
ncbi:MAG: gliding motility-associated C-terminal domain-containing protein [Chitinophagaceae bacterium]